MRQLVIEDRGVIYEAARQPPERRIAFFTALCPLRSGVWLCGFQIGSGKHSPDSTVELCRSADQGKTWTPLGLNLETRIAGVPGSLSAPALCEVAPGRLLLFVTWFDRSDPQRPLFDPVTQGILRSKQLLATSADDGQTWSAWRELATPGLTGCSATGPIVSWPDGTLAFPFESFKQFSDPLPGKHAAWLMVSRDGGDSFSRPLMVAQDPLHRVYYWDQRLCATHRPGEFVALFWTHDLLAQQDCCVHIRRASLSGAAVVGEDIRETTIPGQIAAPLRLADGRLLAFVVDRRNPCTLKLWQSRDDGGTWPESENLVIHVHDERAAVNLGGEPIDFNQYWEDMGKWSFGHPTLRELGDQQVLCAYYAGTPECMSINWAAVKA